MNELGIGEVMPPAKGHTSVGAKLGYAGLVTAERVLLVALWKPALCCSGAVGLRCPVSMSEDLAVLDASGPRRRRGSRDGLEGVRAQPASAFFPRFSGETPGH